MKKSLLGALLVLALAGLSMAQSYQPQFEFSIFGGYALTNVRGATAYSDTYSSYFGYFDPINESTTIDLKSKNGLFFGGSISYFFSPSIGLQLSAGFLNSDVPNTSTVSYSRHNTLNGQTYTDDFAFTGTGTFSSIPISLNLVARFGNDRLSGYLSGGPTLYLNSYEGVSSFGFGIYDYSAEYIYPYLYLTDYVDVLQVGLEIPKTSWTGFGGNIGAGVTFNFSPSVGLTLDARYYLCPAKDLPWNFQLGDYDGLLNTLTGYSFTQDDVDYVLGVSDFMTRINPSFFKITAGISFRFGN
jgi:opacity protein-like surface antigen